MVNMVKVTRPQAPRVPRFNLPQNIDVINRVKGLHWNRVRIGLCVLLIVLFFVQSVVTGSNVWLHIDNLHTQGIFKVCTQVGSGGLDCRGYQVTPGYMKPIQALMICSTLIYVLAFVYFVFMLVKGTWLSLVLTIMIIINVYMVVAGLSIFTDMNMKAVSSSALQWGWSYILGWISVVMAIGAAILSVLDDRYKS